MFETGIKVIDLIEPTCGRQDRVVRRSGCRQDRHHSELINNLAMKQRRVVFAGVTTSGR
jgi:F0F1-type ATP synthase beta subunit